MNTSPKLGESGMPINSHCMQKTMRPSSYLGDTMALPAPYADGAHLALQVEACVRTMAHEVAVKIVAHATQAGMSGERE